MNKIDKGAVLNIYNKLSIVLGLGTFLILLVYFNGFPETMNGTIDKGIFNLDLVIGSGVEVSIFNSPIVWFVLFFVMNLGVLIFTQTGEKAAESKVVESIFYNTILSFFLIVAQIVFYYLIPGTVNGAINIGLFKYEFVELIDKSVVGINFAYILASIYTIYNIVVVVLETRNTELESL